tara:strand:+ start:2231 stop:2407 length:177 start_codon:yes stop_codon:yes gene_type:complete
MTTDLFGNNYHRVIEIDRAKVECSGQDFSHPTVYYSLRVGETKKCMYCNLTWKRIKLT